MRRLMVVLLLASAFGQSKSYRYFQVTQHGNNIIIATLPEKPDAILNTPQLCVGTVQQMHKGGIDCYDAIPMFVPKELRKDVLPARIAIPPSMQPDTNEAGGPG